MKARIIITFCVLICSLALWAQALSSYVPGQLIFKHNEVIQAEELLERIGDYLPIMTFDTEEQPLVLRSLGNQQSRLWLLDFDDEWPVEYMQDLLKNWDEIEYAEPNFIGYGAGVKGKQQTLPDDTYFSRQYNMHNDGTFNLGTVSADADVDMDLAWDIETGDSTIVMAILDSGVKLNHPEFAGRVWTNSGENSDGSDTDNNGYVNDFNGWDFANDDNDPSDDHGHGTNVAGIACATGNNNLGYAGADWHCKMMSLKILNSGNSGQYAWWIDAIYYAVDNGADLLNMSVGGSSFSNGMKDAVDYAYAQGVTVVACMMNFNNATTYYPAGYANTIAVGSTNPDDSRTAPFFWSASSGSSYGTHIDVCAPGNYIYGLAYNSNTNYGTYWGGTSQASPLVCGIASLLIAQDSSRGPDEIRTILRESAEDEVGIATEDVEGFDVYHGWGRVNAFAALNRRGVSVYKPQVSTPKAYPNPSDGEIHLRSISGYNQLLIYSSMGQLVFETGLDGDQLDLKLDLATGNYKLQFISGSGRSASKMIQLF